MTAPTHPNASGGGIAPYACLRLRGLPFSATHADILQFFADYTVLDVLLSKSDGKPNGQAYVMLPEADASKAFLELNNKFIGKRYIEVFSSTIADMETARRMCEEAKAAAAAAAAAAAQSADPTAAARGDHKEAGGGGRPAPPTSAAGLPALMQSLLSLQKPSAQHQQAACPPAPAPPSPGSWAQIVRLRGLPFSASEADVQAFLAPIDLPGGIGSIHLARHPDLRPTGEAYVQLRSEAEVLLALKKHKGMMGKRYVEVFPSCVAEMKQALAHQHHTPAQRAQEYAPTQAPPLVFRPQLGGAGGYYDATAAGLLGAGVLPGRLVLNPAHEQLLAMLATQHQNATALAMAAAGPHGLGGGAAPPLPAFAPAIDGSNIASLLQRQQAAQQQLAGMAGGLVNPGGGILLPSCAGMSALDVLAASTPPPPPSSRTNIAAAAAAAAAAAVAVSSCTPSSSSSCGLNFVPVFSSGPGPLAAAAVQVPLPSSAPCLLSPVGSASLPSQAHVLLSGGLEDALSSGSFSGTAPGVAVSAGMPGGLALYF